MRAKHQARCRRWCRPQQTAPVPFQSPEVEPGSNSDGGQEFIPSQCGAQWVSEALTVSLLCRGSNSVEEDI